MYTTVSVVAHDFLQRTFFSEPPPAQPRGRTEGESPSRGPVLGSGEGEGRGGRGRRGRGKRGAMVVGERERGGERDCNVVLVNYN